MSHEQRVSKNTTWITPKWILDWVGPFFDLDPASCIGHPWPMAIRSYYADGHLKRWSGRVFLNPPYASGQIEPFMRRMSVHLGGGVAVVAARIETQWFQDFCFGAAEAIWFPRGRIHFHRPDGTEATATGFPSCVVFYERPPKSSPRPGVWWRR